RAYRPVSHSDQGRDAAIAQATGKIRRRGSGAIDDVCDVSDRTARHRRLHALLAQVQDEPLDAGPEAHARRVPATDLLREAVIPTAAANGSLRTGDRRPDFEDGPRVIVESAHQTMIQCRWDPLLAKARANAVEMLPAIVAETIDE